MKYLPFLIAVVMLGAAPRPTPSPSPIPRNSTSPRRDDLRMRLDQAAALKSISDDRIVLVRAELKAIEDAQTNTPSLAVQMKEDVTRQLDEYQHWLSLADNGNRVTVRVGEHVTVAMRDQSQWTVTNENGKVLAPVMGVMWIRGIQAVFTAKTRGNSSLRLIEQVPKGMARASRLVTFYVTVI